MRKQPSEYHKQDIGSIYYPWAWESKGVNSITRAQKHPGKHFLPVLCQTILWRRAQHQATDLHLLSDQQLHKIRDKKHVSHSIVSDFLRPHGLWPMMLPCQWNSPDKNARVGSHSLSRGFSQPRGQTLVSCIAGRFFIIWATKEGLPQSQPT